MLQELWAGFSASNGIHGRPDGFGGRRSGRACLGSSCPLPDCLVHVVGGGQRDLRYSECLRTKVIRIRQKVLWIALEPSAKMAAGPELVVVEARRHECLVIGWVVGWTFPRHVQVSCHRVAISNDGRPV